MSPASSTAPPLGCAPARTGEPLNPILALGAVKETPPVSARKRSGNPGTWPPQRRRAATRGTTARTGPTPRGRPTCAPRSWWGVLKRTVREFRDDNLTDWAAALTYYGILAIFPALLVLVAILGLIGESATQPLLDNLATVAPGPAQEIFTSAIENLHRSQGAGGAAADRRYRDGAVVGVELRRRVHPRVELDLRGRGGPALLEAAPDPDRDHAVHDRADLDRRRRGRR